MTSTLIDIFLTVARKVDGAALVTEALAQDAQLVSGDHLRPGRPPGLAVLAVGKVAFPMFAGFSKAANTRGAPMKSVLLISPESRFPARGPALPPGVVALPSDHPAPSARSVAAAHAARAHVEALGPSDHLVVLLSGGGSALMAAPAGDLTLDEKRAAVTAVARGGASIGELNTVRKHLSAIKGGQLALATGARTTVLALSDVIGNDPGTIASGPFSPDATTFAEAQSLLDRFAPEAPARVRDWIDRGVRGLVPETPKPKDARLAHVSYHVLAGPERVPEEARAAIAAAGFLPGHLLRNTERAVPDLAAAYGQQARDEATHRGPARILVGNGEPRIVVTGQGRGGRATHLALLMARELSGMAGASFLAAGTDDRDGSSDASGAVVDGTTWARAEAAGLDPEAAVDRCDSERPLSALGCLVRGPGTSNLLDLHLLALPAR